MLAVKPVCPISYFCNFKFVRDRKKKLKLCFFSHKYEGQL